MSRGGPGPSSRGPRPASALGTPDVPVPLCEDVPVFSVGQVADLVGVQQAFLRRLDEFGVVSPARTEGGQRRYSQADVRRVSEVLTMVDDGITLAGISRILDLQHEVSALHEQLRSTRERLEP